MELLATDLEGDGRPEVIAGTWNGRLVALDGRTGQERWSFDSPGNSFQSGAEAADLDGDGVKELVIASGDGVVRALRADGTLMWERATREGFRARPRVHDARVYVAGSGGTFFAIDAADGRLSWTASTKGSTRRPTPVVADIDGGEPEVLMGDAEGTVYAWDARSGALKRAWKFPGAYCASEVIVDDLDGDGAMELVVPDGRGRVHCVTLSGVPRWRYETQSHTHMASIAADLNGDGARDLVLVSADGRDKRVRVVSGRGVRVPTCPTLLDATTRTRSTIER
jgi:outer membrane protein assembly factor BamB